MWSSTVGFSALTARGRWKVEFFCSPETLTEGTAAMSGLVPIRSLVSERKESIDPSSLGDSLINYVGLEHIQSLTGEWADHFAPRRANEVKSRSKIFKEDDVLFGRLRPNLNKVAVAQGTITEGICSNEIFVLTPVKSAVLPMVLRYLLSSHYVQRHASRLQTGTALPRMGLDDLLSIEVPVPPMHLQKQLEATLRRDFGELIALRAKVKMLPTTILDAFLAVAEGAPSTN